jgi:hypothetical protein
MRFAMTNRPFETWHRAGAQLSDSEPVIGIGRLWGQELPATLQCANGGNARKFHVSERPTAISVGSEIAAAKRTFNSHGTLSTAI